MTSNWKLTLNVKSSQPANTKALADALTTDEPIFWDQDHTSFSFTLQESKAKDLRAMWNTRVRGLIAVDSLLDMLDESKKGEHSTTSTE